MLKKIIAFTCLALCSFASEKAKVILIAGQDSHGPGDHEFLAGCTLLKNKLDASMGDKLETVLVEKNWPKDESIFNDADAIVIYSDGLGRHPIKSKQEFIGKLMDKGVGLAMMHFACDVPKGIEGENFKKWIGGHYETRWSTNPHWTCDSILHKTHPISKSVKDFSVNDEWYFNMRWADQAFHTDILKGVPDKVARSGKSTHPRGPFKHIVDAEGREETLMWAVERKDGGRGFGFTGGHNHENWANDEYRKLILNAIVWLAKVEVPENGVASMTPTEQELIHMTKKDRGVVKAKKKKKTKK